MCEVKGAPVDMMLFILNTDDNLVAFSEQRDAKGVSAVSVCSHFIIHVRWSDEELETTKSGKQ